MDSALFLENLSRSFGKQSPYLPGYGRPEIRAIRQKALDQACHQNLPSIRLDLWKHARFDILIDTAFMPYLHSPSKQSIAKMAPYIDSSAEILNLVFLNGHYIPSLSHHNHIEIRLQSLARLARIQPELLVDFHKNYPEHFFSQLNTAFCNDGAIVIIPDNIHLTKVIVITNFIMNEEHEPHMIHPQTHIHLGKNSEVTIIEKSISLSNDTKTFMNNHTELFCDQGSLCHLYRFTQHAPSTWGFHQLRGTLLTSAQLDMTELAFGAHYQRHEVNIHLKAPSAVFNCHGLLLPNTFEHCDWVSHVSHYAESGKSMQKIKAIIGFDGHSSFLGNIAVNQAAQHTHTLMVNDSLLLGEKGQADSAPQLEILADEVKCNHAATISQLNEQMLFYLQSRGFNKAQARELLLKAFTDDIMQSINHLKILTDWQAIVSNRLNNLRGAE